MEEDEGRIVPQLKIGIDGSIMIDEQRYGHVYSVYVIFIRACCL